MMKEIEVLPPTIVDGVPIPRKVAYVEDGGGGCGCLIAVIVAAVVILAAILGSGCSPRYTVIPADREAVPVKQTGDSPRTYTEATEDATGWYIPDATLLDLLGAD